MLAVKNNTGNPFTGRYDGVDYSFPPGEEVMITMDAARHIFGVGEADKTHVLVRHGWMKGSGERDAAMNILNGFSFGATRLVPAAEVVEAEAEEGTTQALVQGGADGESVSDGAEEPSEPSLPKVDKPKGGILGGIMGGKK